MVEQRTLNPSVQSSSLCAPTIFQPAASKGAAGYSFCGVRAQVNLGLLDSLLRFRAPSMHPRLLSAAFLAVFSLAVRAESPDEACLKEAASLLSPSQTVSAAFRMEKILPRMARPLPARGRVLVAPGEGLIWETTFPFKEMRVFGQKRWAATDANGALQVHDIRTDRFEALLGQSRGELLASLKRTFFVKLLQGLMCGALGFLLCEKYMPCTDGAFLQTFLQFSQPLYIASAALITVFSVKILIKAYKM